MMVYNQNDIWQGRSFDTYGEYSEEEVILFRKHIKPGHTVFDVGANIGSHTLAFSRLVGPTGLVVAIEPERHNFYTLCGNVAVNNIRNVFCFQQALGKETGSIDIPEIDEATTNNFGAIDLTRDYSKFPHYPVTLNTLDNIGVDKCDFIKIDVEGMEKAVIEGAINKINKFKPILYVEDDRTEKSQELREYIKSLDYKIYKHYPRFFNPQNFYEEPINVFNDTTSWNLFCHHNSINPDVSGLEQVL